MRWARVCLLPIISALLLACGPSDTHSTGTTERTDGALVMPWDSAAVWSGLKLRLPIVPLPFRCELMGTDPEFITLNPREQRLLNGTDYEQGVAIGMLPDTALAFHVLWLGAADSWLPMVSSFTREGRRIRIEELVIGQCGGPEPCYSCAETVHIDVKLDVLTTDTVHACECDSNYAEIPGTCTRYVMKRTGHIGPTGARMSAVMKEPLSLAETPEASAP
jgi:hypothetical protein